MDFYITYMADLSGTTKNETLMITICWTEFHIKLGKKILLRDDLAYLLYKYNLNFWFLKT